jgi:hypothetical protein
MNGLERVFSEGHQFYNVIFYDVLEGQYYNKSSDLYLSLEEVKSYGIPS